MEPVLARLNAAFGGRVTFQPKRPHVVQVCAPLFHEDGDMVEIYLDLSVGMNGKLRLSDHGMTLMRLSYSYDVDTPAKQKILNRILSENGVSEDGGRLFLDADFDEIYPALLQFSQTIAKVTNMQAFRREVVQSLFYEDLAEFISTSLQRYNPAPNFLPLPKRDDLEVDWRFEMPLKDIYLYGVKDNAKSRLAALSCLEFQKADLAFRSIVVHEDFETGLSRKDRVRITSAADKQFTSLEDFKLHGPAFFGREQDASRIH